MMLTKTNVSGGGLKTAGHTGSGRPMGADGMGRRRGAGGRSRMRNAGTEAAPHDGKIPDSADMMGRDKGVVIANQAYQGTSDTLTRKRASPSPFSSAISIVAQGPAR